MRTSWGTHSMFTVATWGGSTSESTPTTGGVIALLLSYGIQAYADHLIPEPLDRAAGHPGHAGHGHPVHRHHPGLAGHAGDGRRPRRLEPAVRLRHAQPLRRHADGGGRRRQIPAGVHLHRPRPDWYSSFDPTTTTSVAVTGHIDAATPTTTFTLAAADIGLGGQPANSAFTTIDGAWGSATFNGTLGTLDPRRRSPSRTGLRPTSPLQPTPSCRAPPTSTP